MFLIYCSRFIFSVFLSAIDYYFLFHGKELVLPIFGVLFYFLIFHFLIQYWFARFFMFCDPVKEKKFIFFPLFALLSPVFILILVFDLNFYDLNIFAVFPFLLSYAFLFFSLGGIFKYFSGLDDSQKWGGESFREFYFSRYPPCSNSDMFGMNALVVFVFFVTFLSLMF